MAIATQVLSGRGWVDLLPQLERSTVKSVVDDQLGEIWIVRVEDGPSLKIDRRNGALLYLGLANWRAGPTAEGDAPYSPKKYVWNEEGDISSKEALRIAMEFLATYHSSRNQRIYQVIHDAEALERYPEWELTLQEGSAGGSLAFRNLARICVDWKTGEVREFDCTNVAASATVKLARQEAEEIVRGQWRELHSPDFKGGQIEIVKSELLIRAERHDSAYAVWQIEVRGDCPPTCSGIHTKRTIYGVQAENGEVKFIRNLH